MHGLIHYTLIGVMLRVVPSQRDHSASRSTIVSAFALYAKPTVVSIVSLLCVTSMIYIIIGECSASRSTR